METAPQQSAEKTLVETVQGKSKFSFFPFFSILLFCFCHMCVLHSQSPSVLNLILTIIHITVQEITKGEGIPSNVEVAQSIESLKPGYDVNRERLSDTGKQVGYNYCIHFCSLFIREGI